MAMSLEDGGHLTHGHPVTGSAKIYNFVRYGIKDSASGEIDYDKMITDARKLKPKIILAGFLDIHAILITLSFVLLLMLPVQIAC